MLVAAARGPPQGAHHKLTGAGEEQGPRDLVHPRDMRGAVLGVNRLDVGLCVEREDLLRVEDVDYDVDL